MCRLAAYFGPPASPADLLYGGSPPLAQQAWAPRELLSGSVNADGWGIAWTVGAEMVRLARPEPVWYDPQVEPLLRTIRSGVQLAALRNATPGLPVGGAGLLPIVEEGWAFALNGYVPDFRVRRMRTLRSTLSDARYARLMGVSDAETLFLLLLDAIEGGTDPLESMAELRERVRGLLDPGEGAPLTMVLAGGDGVWALNSSAAGPVNSLYLGEAVAPVGGGWTLASEPLGDGAWERVPEHHGVVMNAEGASIREV